MGLTYAAYRVGRSLRVCPGSNCIFAELAEHQPDGCPTEEGEAVAAAVLLILGQPAAAVEPGDGALDQPTLGQHDEAVRLGPLDDLHVELVHRLLHRLGKRGPWYPASA